MSTDRLQTYAADPLVFVADLVIPSAHGPMRFGDCWADFQREWFQAVAPSLVAVARGERPPIGRFWVERTKGASKDADLAVCLIWLLAFTRRPLDCQVGAADQDQADELRKAARDVLRLNPWLAERVTLQNWRILCQATDSGCDIVASDVAGSHGARPDVLLLNEVSHIPDGKESFALTLLDNASKKPQGLVLAASNAGFWATWQWRLRELARESSRWHFHVWNKPAPWLDLAEIDEAKRRNSASRFARLFWGVWASGTGDALDAEDIAACVNDKAGPMSGDEPGYGWVAGLDLGIKADLSALCVIGIDARNQAAKLAGCMAWAPGPSGEIDLSEVEIACAQAAWEFPGLVIGYDPHQAQHLAQRLRRRGVNMFEVPFTGKNCDAMASAVLQVFRSRTIELYPDKELIRDLGKLRIEERSWGYKLVAPRDRSTGHCDRAVAFSIAVSGIMPSIGGYREPIDDGLGSNILVALFGHDYLSNLSRN